MDDISPSLLAIGSLSFIVSIFSVACSVTNIWLIHDMKLWSGYIALVYSLSISQLIYDLSFFLIPCLAINSEFCQAAFVVLTSFAGILCTIWTNIMSYVFVAIVLFGRPINVLKHFPIIIFCALSISIIFGVAIGVEYFQDYNSYVAVNYVYYYFRLVSIVFNIIVYAASSTSLYFNLNRGGKVTTSLIGVLVSRFKYYPACQAITRAGASWYEILFGFGDNFASQFYSTTGLISFACSALLTPLAGIGYFLIFLYMQPNALAHLKSKFALKSNDILNSRISHIDVNPSERVFDVSEVNINEENRPGQLRSKSRELSRGTSVTQGDYDDMNEEDLITELTRMNSLVTSDVFPVIEIALTSNTMHNPWVSKSTN